MKEPRVVYVLVLSGESSGTERIVGELFPGCDQHLLTKRELRERGWRRALSNLRALRGAALVTQVNSVAELDHAPLLVMTGLVHGCSRNVLVDSPGNVRECSRLFLLSKVPRLMLAGVIDVFVLLCGWLMLKACAAWANRPVQRKSEAGAAVDLAYLYPVPMQEAVPGGEMSYVKGTLSGLKEMGATCDVYSSCELPNCGHPTHLVSGRIRSYLLREAVELSYNWRFFWKVRNQLAKRTPSCLYQRHWRFTIPGALLSHLLGIPLILEYQSSEVWRAKNWDPMHFLGILAACEELQLRAATRFVVLSSVLKHELMMRGVPESRIVVNPAGVDPKQFSPRCGRDPMREQMGFRADEVIVTFVGSFSYWHGVFVLQDAILELLSRSPEKASNCCLRFLLVGDGLLRQDMQRVLTRLEQRGRVAFLGLVPHDRIPALLDASDILVSPHLPLETGEAFFGSPSKLFEYMAMGKAIVASKLDQIGEVLTHAENGWLVTPGDVQELALAIERLADDRRLREKLGANARRLALEKHTWRENARRLLTELRDNVQAPGSNVSVELLEEQVHR